MTGHWCDFKNADVILTIGSNNVENHPVSSKWVERAQDNGATWIVVDPRYTRSAEVADIYAPIRSGTDIAFFGGLFNYIIENDLWQKEYVVNYTNASYLINEDFDFDVTSGFFSGYDDGIEHYRIDSWMYQLEKQDEWDTSENGDYSWVNGENVPEFTPPKVDIPKKDPTLQDPNCVFQHFKRHYERYDLETVSSVTGIEVDLLEKVYSVFASTGEPGKVGTILYALGQTQHTVGTQNCRSMSILQLLLGNAGLAGGGVSALRGEPNVQGCTDLCLKVEDMPGYLVWPRQEDTKTLKQYLETQTVSSGYWANRPKFLVSFLKEWYGDNATVENDYAFDYLPKVPEHEDVTYMKTFDMMRDGTIKGYFVWGMNPAQSAPNAAHVQEALCNLDFMVAVDIHENETACFWKAPTVDPKDVKTTVYFLPVTGFYEKAGTLVNSGRWIQYRHKCIEPMVDAKPDYEIADILFRRLRDLYLEEGGTKPEPITKLYWDYNIGGKVDYRAIDWALNGYKWGEHKSDGSVELLQKFNELQADGSTACGCWIYTGFWANNDDPFNPDAQAVGRRGKEDKSGLGLNSDWAFAWPDNRRVLYNRASCDVEGKPWNPEKVLVEWTGKSWNLIDNPDFVANSNGEPVPPNNNAFFMTWEQNGRIFAPTLKEGPFPEHYEPFESPTRNVLNGAQNSPNLRYRESDSVKPSDVNEHPIVATTYQVTEHWLSGSTTRRTPVLSETMPYQFAEISLELAEEKGIENGDIIRVYNNRSSIEMHAMVTARLRPFKINGDIVHQIGLPHHFGWSSDLLTGPIVNEITPNVGDADTSVPEYKAFLVNIEKVY